MPYQLTVISKKTYLEYPGPALERVEGDTPLSALYKYLSRPEFGYRETREKASDGKIEYGKFLIKTDLRTAASAKTAACEYIALHLS
ncbi:MAG: hypothetical protein ACT4OY_02380 [Alphaproteobacteria bacterium]